jgi:hypothetical protein
MVAAGNRTVPAHDQVFRMREPGMELGDMRVSDHYVPELERIEIARQETVSGTHVEGGPYNDKLNNMYMRSFDHMSTPFQKCYEGHRAANIRGRPSKSHGKNKTPWRDPSWKQHQANACPGTQKRLGREKDAATVAAYRGLKEKEEAAQVELFREKEVPVAGYQPVVADRAGWRRAGQGVLHGRRKTPRKHAVVTNSPPASIS